MKAGYLAGPVQLQDLASKAADTGGSVLDHLHAVRTVLMGQMAVATEAGDGRGAAYIAGRLTATLEVIARISGELGDLARSVNFSVTNNIAVLTEHPAFARVQATLLQALAPHPEARAAVVSALRALDDQNAPAAFAGPAISKVIDHVAV
jgi:ABC-type phosphate/phosphonate transport system substrate-binding protein